MLVTLVLLALGALAASCTTSSKPIPVADGRPGTLATQPTTPPCTPASLEERAARVLLVGLPEITSSSDPLVAEVLELGVGGVLLTHTNVHTVPQAQGLVSGLRTGSRVPLLVTADEEPGRVRTLEELYGRTLSARRMARERSVEEAEQDGRVTGGRLAGLGVKVNMAPVLDLDDGPWDGIVGDRSFSADPEQASAYGLAYARGLMAAGVIPVFKHFPGHGRASADSHITAPEVDAPLPVLQATDLRPFADAVAAGAPIVMLGHVAYDALERGLPASVSPAAYRLLRDMGFRGAAITDSVGMGAVNLRWDFDEAVVVAVAAGADGVLATDGRQARRMRDSLVTAVQSGRVDEARLNEAAGRMMALAGGDPMTLSCTSPQLPTFRTPDPSPAPPAPALAPAVVGR
ncbi:MAG: glycoside hydrolase family 3 protein [Actinomycetota bacterium]|nr:glycoside hydrolase family 3 protein [Actinomycetota bacterium]